MRWLILLTVILSLMTLAINVGAVEVYFSPGHECEDRLVNAITSAKHSIHAVVYSINNPRIVHALVVAHIRGVEVEILTDRKQAEAEGSCVNDLEAAGISVRLHRTGHLEHNVFAVFDGALAMNGSSNWTEGATENSENCTLMPEAQAVASFDHRFIELWRATNQQTSISSR